MILCSACLLGIRCRHDGRSKPDRELIAFAARNPVLPICPEIMAGLSVPRDATERKGRKMITCSGRDVTRDIVSAGRRILALAKAAGIGKAVMKQKSAACGCGLIYDGTFSGRIVEGDGMVTEMLKKSGMKVVSERKLSALLKLILLVMFLSNCAAASADEIFLKNGRSISGRIKSELPDAVVIDIGFGSITVHRKDIARVKRDEVVSATADFQKVIDDTVNPMATGSTSYAEINALSELYKKAKSLRYDTIKLWKEYDVADFGCLRITRELPGVTEKYNGLKSKLDNMGSVEVDDYNRVLSQVNSAEKRINRLIDRRVILQKTRRELGAQLSESMIYFKSALTDLEREFLAGYAEVKKRGMSKEEAVFFQGLEPEVESFKLNLSRMKIDCENVSGMWVVDVVLDSREKLLFMINPEYPYTTITEQTAKRLGLDVNNTRPLKISLSGGEEFDNVMAVVGTVKAGPALIKNVEVAVTAEPVGQGIEGFLGSTFLVYFITDIDPVDASVSLEEFRFKN